VPDEDKKKQNNEEYKFTFSPKNKKKETMKITHELDNPLSHYPSKH
jgi:hypothetical protein